MFLHNSVADIEEDPTTASGSMEVDFDNGNGSLGTTLFQNMFDPTINQGYLDAEAHLIQKRPTAKITKFRISPQDYKAFNNQLNGFGGSRGFVLSINGVPVTPGQLKFHAPAVQVLGRFDAAPVPAAKPCTCGAASCNSPKHSHYCDSLK